MSVTSEDMKFTTRDGLSYDGRLSLPAGDGSATGVLIMPAIFGTDHEMVEQIASYAADGFLTAAPDYFHRTVPGPTADREVAVGRMGTFDIDQGLLDLEDAMAQLRAHPRCNGKVAVLGYCFGGLFAFLAGTRLGADAVGSYHGTRIHQCVDEADKLTVPASLHYGDADPTVPMDQVEIVQAALAGKPGVDVQVYAGGKHNFSMPTKAGYDEAIARASRAAVVEAFSAI